MSKYLGEKNIMDRDRQLQISSFSHQDMDCPSDMNRKSSIIPPLLTPWHVLDPSPDGHHLLKCRPHQSEEQDYDNCYCPDTSPGRRFLTQT
ncbi:hypothetical protein LEMLEM_LOCUS16902 [Lemmus lemmus]